MYDVFFLNLCPLDPLKNWFATSLLSTETNGEKIGKKKCCEKGDITIAISGTYRA